MQLSAVGSPSNQIAHLQEKVLPPLRGGTLTRNASTVKSQRSFATPTCCGSFHIGSTASQPEFVPVLTALLILNQHVSQKKAVPFVLDRHKNDKKNHRRNMNIRLLPKMVAPASGAVSVSRKSSRSAGCRRGGHNQCFPSHAPIAKSHLINAVACFARSCCARKTTAKVISFWCRWSEESQNSIVMENELEAFACSLSTPGTLLQLLSALQDANCINLSAKKRSSLI